MEKMRWIFGGLIWPVAFLSLRKMPLLHRVNFFAAGIANVSLFFFLFWLALDLGHIHLVASAVFLVGAAILVIVYCIGYFAYLCKRIRMFREDTDNNIKPMSDEATDNNREVITSEFKTRKDFIDTFERMKRHGKKARIAWDQAEYGPCNIMW